MAHGTLKNDGCKYLPLHSFVYNPFCSLQPHDKCPSVWQGAEYKDSTEIHRGWVAQVQEEAIPRAVTQGRLRSPHCVALLDSGLSFLSGPTPLHHFVLATPASWNMLSAGLCLGP